MEMNQQTLREFREDYMEAVKVLEEKYGVVISMKGITYTSNEFHFKTEVVNGENQEDVRRVTFNQHCSNYWLEREDYLRTFTNRGVEYQIVGLAPNKKKYPVIIKDLRTNKEYGCTPEFIPWVKERKDNWYRDTYNRISNDSNENTESEDGSLGFFND